MPAYVIVETDVHDPSSTSGTRRLHPERSRPAARKKLREGAANLQLVAVEGL
jgi:hypothetical protein